MTTTNNVRVKRANAKAKRQLRKAAALTLPRVEWKARPVPRTADLLPPVNWWARRNI
jgi:hypothetical protein